ncbi:MAG: PhnD/SsuA/transferrin family substrate-binding protein [Gammaproteobacteria bacterium]|nr:PhnD/SsuA/transferrin family substrate-binding protein [Gammaproteobacteria bacterium]
MDWKAFATVVLSLMFSSVNAEYVLSAPPRETPEAGAAVYGPLADSLGQVLGESVVYRHPGNWAAYGRNMRDGMYDFVFDAPHFGSWRIEHLNHTPLAALPGKLDFVIVSTNPEIKTGKDLISKRFCGLESPNMGTLIVQNMFRNPVQQPVYVFVKGGVPAVFNALTDGKCEAGVLRSPYYFKKLSDADRSRVKLVQQTKPTPNQTLTGSPRLSNDAKVAIMDMLTDPARAKVGSQALFARFSKNATAWERPDVTAYTYLNLLLEGQAWGW